MAPSRRMINISSLGLSAFAFVLRIGLEQRGAIISTECRYTGAALPSGIRSRRPSCLAFHPNITRARNSSTALIWRQAAGSATRAGISARQRRRRALARCARCLSYNVGHHRAHIFARRGAGEQTFGGGASRGALRRRAYMVYHEHSLRRAVLVHRNGDHGTATAWRARAPPSLSRYRVLQALRRCASRHRA